MKRSIGAKIVHHFYPRLDIFYFSNNYDYPEVIKGEYRNEDSIFVVRNAKNELKLSSSDKYGTTVLTNDEIVSIMEKELAKERPKLNQLIEDFDMLLLN